MVDPKPGVTAAYGTRKLLDGFRWSMTPDAVMAVLTRQIEEEYKKMQAMEQVALADTRDPRMSMMHTDEARISNYMIAT